MQVGSLAATVKSFDTHWYHCTSLPQIQWTGHAAFEVLPRLRRRRFRDCRRRRPAWGCRLPPNRSISLHACTAHIHTRAMPALAASAARAPSAQALLRLQPGLQPLRAARLARWSKGWPIGLPRGGPQPADRPAASAGSSGGGGDAQEGAEGSADLSSSRPSSGPDAPTTKQTLEALDQLLGVELKPVEQPAPPPPAAEKRPAAAQQPRRPGEPQLTFYDPNEASL